MGNCSGKLFPPFATPFARARLGWHTPLLLVNFALRPRDGIHDRFHQLRPPVNRSPRMPNSSLGAFDLFFLTGLLITAPRVRLSHLVSTPPCRCQTTAPAPSGAPSPSKKPILQPKLLFTAELGFSHLLFCVAPLDTGSPQTTIG